MGLYMGKVNILWGSEVRAEVSGAACQDCSNVAGHPRITQGARVGEL